MNISISYTSEGLQRLARKDIRYRHFAIGDKVCGGRLDKYFAVVEEITPDHVGIRYNGECRIVRVPHGHNALTLKADANADGNRRGS